MERLRSRINYEQHDCCRRPWCRTPSVSQAPPGITNMRSLTRTGGDLVVRTTLILAVGVALCLRVLTASALPFTGIGTDPFAPPSGKMPATMPIIVVRHS